MTQRDAGIVLGIVEGDSPVKRTEAIWGKENHSIYDQALTATFCSVAEKPCKRNPLSKAIITEITWRGNLNVPQTSRILASYTVPSEARVLADLFWRREKIVVQFHVLAGRNGVGCASKILVKERPEEKLIICVFRKTGRKKFNNFEEERSKEIREEQTNIIDEKHSNSADDIVLA
ncbi:unnamed protein product [Cylicocyclus nassatus]|uniref:Uncharacterized protein n=1 Tax=Cylicocyclus nassatus TaxID=53992 RepID=A0AA36M2Y6_CYLNA|nr:unnamed protein product [Cylicocyclus nassatus]